MSSRRRDVRVRMMFFFFFFWRRMIPLQSGCFFVLYDTILAAVQIAYFRCLFVGNFALHRALVVAYTVNASRGFILDSPLRL